MREPVAGRDGQPAIARCSETIRFDRADLDLFSDASHDRNPLHLSDAYARRTPYGERVVHGALAAIAGLARSGARSDRALSHVNLTFRHPLFVGVAYRIDADRQSPDQLRFRILDGERVMTTAVMTFGPAAARRVAAVSGTASRLEPADRALEDMVPGLSAGGFYAPSSGDLDRLLARWPMSGHALTGEAGAALLWCSYVVGMELPGRQALFWSVDMQLHAQISEYRTPLAYRATVVRSNVQLEYVDIDAELLSADAPVATARLRAFVRRDSPVCDAAALQGWLPPSRRLAGTRAVVVGGSRGLGAAIVQGLVTQGCTVLSTFRESRDDAERLTATLHGMPGAVEMIQGNAADEGWCREVLCPRFAGEQGLDILICNASPPIRPVDLSFDGIQRFRQFAAASLDLVSVPLAALLDPLCRRSGCCTLISSSVVRSPPRDWPHYVAAKAAAEGLISWAAANYDSVRFLIARPPRLLTDQMNTPAGRQGALPVERAAAAIIRRVCDPRGHEPVEVLDTF